MLVPVQQLHHAAASSLRWACASEEAINHDTVPDFEIMKFYLPTTILTLAVFHLFFFFFDSGFYVD